MTADLSLGHWLLCVAVEPPPLSDRDEAEPGQDGGGTVTFCMGQKRDRDEAAAGGTGSARPPIPGPLHLLPQQVTMG